MRVTLGSSMALVALFACAAVSAAVEGERGGEAGVFAGIVLTDENLSMEDGGTTEATLGIRGGSVFARRWTWFTDILASRVATAEPALGDALTYWGRTGFELFLRPEHDLRWFLGAGAGWMKADFESSSAEDFDRPFVSGGFGQRWVLGPSAQLRWEVRGDVTVDQEGLGEEAVGQGLGLIGVVWGPRVEPGSSTAATAKVAAAPADTDADGVADERDRCAATPSGATVDARGCPSDADQDGVLDGLDRCPASPRGNPVSASGCAADADGDGVLDMTDTCPDSPPDVRVDDWGCPLDGDRDSVPDGIDSCPRTARGATTDARGCPLDGDADGVWDGLDECPATPAGTSVSTTGCPLVGIEFDTAHDAVVLWLGFGPGSAVLDPAAAEVLDRVQQQLEQVPGRFVIGGHADPRDDGPDPLGLSKRRAQAVFDALVDRGVPASRLEVHGYGTAHAITPTPGSDAARENRRIELRRK